MAKEAKQGNDDTVRCYCLSNKGKMHCPLSTDRRFLENYFNYQVRSEDIVEVEIDKAFVCTDERTHHCKNCPFK